MKTTKDFSRRKRNRSLAALCLISLMLTAPAVQANKVVVIPLGSTTNIGASIYWTGEWQDGFQYAIGDGMQYGGSSYLCVKDHVSSSANTPPNGTYWSLMAEKGDIGPQGSSGAQGPQGVAGTDGAQGVQGAQGPQGVAGPQGADGAQGFQGAEGPQGVAGPQGAQGPSGTSSWTDATGKVTATVDVGIGTGAATPGAKLHVDGEIKMEATAAACDTASAGKIRWSGSDFEGCNGTSWVTFTYSPVVIPTVTSATGKVWMDRNLGASQVATLFDDTAAYGDLYQWGRPTDGHEQRDSGTVGTQWGGA
ncbi:hypothetical protein [Candidatus Electrothrix sp.]|uniref:hypothetical protein n=1 Tax=Candidatus Electrothrix sp. TaxID=2170559 RepID=UPI0040560175